MAYKYCVDRHEDNTHYGSAATILVQSWPSIDLQKVTSTLVHRTDFNAFAEIGHSWLDPRQPRAFYAWGEWGGYNMVELPYVTPGTSHRYWVAYKSSDSRHYFWMDDSAAPVASKVISNMTSSWSCVNAERDGAAAYGDNIACFSVLKYRTATWGSWSYWDGSTMCDDNDVYHHAVVNSSSHIDVVREAY